ncbi:hypothetical protein VIBNISOn1_1390016 [Vibrio nigripulchritudo SOn1]|uniref:Uncharacterized protein n=1 Tax=Vibrio nigripulchritudo SOn1 TaxID=1238450 RepID=A0AAV2VKC4_9VIBR|nr:hypothetical protein VIBNISOn1_1390016 [Vibrio nigripulchritudo SOn1]
MLVRFKCPPISGRDNQHLIRAVLSAKDLALYNEELHDLKITFPKSTSYLISNIRSIGSKMYLA